MGTLDGRVAIVTGAGRGIGREHALLLAKEGAKVLVNDIGGANDGTGTDTTPAQSVVDEIVAAGGAGAVNYDNVATWDGAERMVKQAIDELGGLDILVNNAGILRDAFIPNLTEDQWDAVVGVVLKGTAGPTHHAAAYWKEQTKAGVEVNASVINTASASGTFMPNAGQANYGAAKAAVAALTLVAADELDRYGVRSNVIAPIARTRLTLATPGMGAIFAEEVEEGEFDAWHPSNISPLVARLASPDCKLNGRFFAVQGGVIQEMQGWHEVAAIESEGPWDLDDLANRLG
ncbi:MAG TPA: SDR family oxidoreductase [Nocardioides sp.]|nr:SDR family oxidoreductase [Nocardioides sp.]